METENTALLNKLTWLWVFFFTLDAFANGIVLSLTNVDWGTLSSTKKLVVISMVLKTWSGVMISLFTKTASRIEQGKSIIPSDSTQMWQKAPDLTAAPQPSDIPKT